MADPVDQMVTLVQRAPWLLHQAIIRPLQNPCTFEVGALMRRRRVHVLQHLPSLYEPVSFQHPDHLEHSRPVRQVVLTQPCPSCYPGLCPPSCLAAFLDEVS
jgi:hypothetical protein